MLPVAQGESEVAGRALQVGVDRRSSLAFKGAGTERELTRATFRQQKFRTRDGLGAMYIEYSVVGPLAAV